MVQTVRRCLDVNLEELQQELERKRSALGEEAYQKLRTGLEALRYLQELVADQDMTMAELRRLVHVHGGTEKTREVLRRAGVEAASLRPAPPAAGAPPDAGPRTAAPGHGRAGAAAYTGARRIGVPHEILRPGDRCPECGKGKLYPLREPKRQIRFVGQAPVMATVYERDRFRCNLCNEVFTAAAPAGLSEDTYDPTAASMIAQLKYGSGVPFYRLAGLQARLKIPLPESTQCEIVQEVAGKLQPVLDELIRQAAQGEVLHNDDTGRRSWPSSTRPHPTRDRPRPAPGCSRRRSWRPRQATRSRSTSPAASTPARISPQCWPTAPPSSPHPSKCAMR